MSGRSQTKVVRCQVARKCQVAPKKSRMPGNGWQVFLEIPENICFPLTETIGRGPAAAAAAAGASTGGP